MSVQSSTEHVDVRYVAGLARIELTADEVERYGRQLGEILAYARQLERFDVAGIMPTAHATPRANVCREDEPRPSMDRAAMLANAPAVHADGVSVQVPAVIEEQY